MKTVAESLENVFFDIKDIRSFKARSGLVRRWRTLLVSGQTRIKRIDRHTFKSTFLDGSTLIIDEANRLVRVG